MTDRDGRVGITEEQFLSSLGPNLSKDVRTVIDDLIKWSEYNNLIDDFSTGDKGPAFTPKISRPEKVCRTFYVQADGWIVIPIRWMNDRLPFSDPAKCQELVNRIEDIPGSVVTDKASDGFPKFPAASLTSPDQRSEEHTSELQSR